MHASEKPPVLLLETPGNCGLLAAWMALRHFGKRVRATRIVHETRHTLKHGVFAIALATALDEFGLEVSFHTDPDPSPHRLELAAYRRAQSWGLPVLPALDLDGLQTLVASGAFAIPLLEGWDSEGHLAPIARIANRRVEFVDQSEPPLPELEFIRRWTAEGTLGQCVIVYGRRLCA